MTLARHSVRFTQHLFDRDDPSPSFDAPCQSFDIHRLEDTASRLTTNNASDTLAKQIAFSGHFQEQFLPIVVRVDEPPMDPSRIQGAAFLCRCFRGGLR